LGQYKPRYLVFLNTDWPKILLRSLIWPPASGKPPGRAVSAPL